MGGVRGIRRCIRGRGSTNERVGALGDADSRCSSEDTRSARCGGVRAEVAGIRTGCEAGGGAAVAIETGDSELHAAVGEVDGGV